MTPSINVNTYNVYLGNLQTDDDFNRLANQAEEALDAYNNDVKSGQSTAISGPVMIAALQQLAAHWGISATNPVGTPPTDPIELKIYNQLISHCVADSTQSLAQVLFNPNQSDTLALLAKSGNQNLFEKDSRGSDSIYNDIDASGNVKTDQGHYSKEIQGILALIDYYENPPFPLNPTAKEALAESIGIQLGQLGNDLKNGFPDQKINPATDGFLTAISLMLGANCTVSGTTQTLLSLFTSSTSTPAQIQAALDSGAMSDLQTVLSDAQKWDS